MPETQLFTLNDRFPVPIDQIAIPSDITIFGNHFGQNTYYADFAGIAKKYAARRIMEIGVRFGYSGLAMCLGARAAHEDPIIYRGCDAEYFGNEHEGAEGYKLYRSNAIAGENFRRFAPWVDAKLFTVNTQQQPLPAEIVGGEETVNENYTIFHPPMQFDLINVDGDHSFVGALKDCWETWPLLAPGGIMLVDDMSFAEVGPAVHEFVRQVQAEGHQVDWQYHRNERDMMFIRKNA